MMPSGELAQKKIKRFTVNLGHDGFAIGDNADSLPNLEHQYFIEEPTIEIEDDFIPSVWVGEINEYETPFFVSNMSLFFSKYDWQLIQNDPQRSLFINAVGQEFDKINGIVNSLVDYIDVDKADDSVLQYLAYLLGHELINFDLNTFNLRELIKNLIDIYRIKGTNYAYTVFFNSLGFDVEMAELWWEMPAMPSEFSEEGISSYEDVAFSNAKYKYLKRWDELSATSKSQIKQRFRTDSLDYYENRDLFYKLNKSNYISVRITKKDEEVGLSFEELNASLDYINFLTPAHINVLRLNLITVLFEQFYTVFWDPHGIIARYHTNPDTEEDIDLIDTQVLTPTINDINYPIERLFFNKFNNFPLPYIESSPYKYTVWNHLFFNKNSSYKYKDGFSDPDYQFNTALGLYFDVDLNKERFNELYALNKLPTFWDKFRHNNINHIINLFEYDGDAIVADMEYFTGFPIHPEVRFFTEEDLMVDPEDSGYHYSTNESEGITSIFELGDLENTLTGYIIEENENFSAEDGAYSIPKVLIPEDIIFDDNFFGNIMEYDYIVEYNDRGEDSVTPRSQLYKDRRDRYYNDELYVGFTYYQIIDGIKTAMVESEEDIAFYDNFSLLSDFGFEDISVSDNEETNLVISNSEEMELEDDTILSLGKVETEDNFMPINASSIKIYSRPYDSLFKTLLVEEN